MPKVRPEQPGSLTNYNCALERVPWLPYGLSPENGNNPYQSSGADPQSINNDYACGPVNAPTDPSHPAASNFWGWDKLYGLVDQIAATAVSKGLVIEELDLQNEVDLYNFPVQARLIYDNWSQKAVLQYLGQALASRGFSGSVVTVSVPTNRPDVEAGQVSSCQSAYGDPATIMPTTEVFEATGGGAGVIGRPRHVSFKGDLPCDASSPPNGPCPDPTRNPSGWASCAILGMTPIPGSASQPVPTITDMHFSPCILFRVGNSTLCRQDYTQTSDGTTAAQNMFSDVWTYLMNHSLTGNTVMFGETWSNSLNPGCDNSTQAMAQQSVSGFLDSSLKQNGNASSIVFRPWENAAGDSTCTTPALVGAPSGPYKQ